jgi:hypothetical protein
MSSRLEADLVVDVLQQHDTRIDRLEDPPKDQLEKIHEAGLPADLVATETNVFRRLSPASNRWPEIAMVRLYKELFGQGPTKASTHYAPTRCS